MQIDLIIPMVFPDDPVWQAEYARTSGERADAARRNVRFRSWSTEELLVRCCVKYMPWLRTIHILLASESQVQPWMQKTKNGTALNPVFHREFIPGHLLPCFNICTIEMFLHKIPGLSETFIYGNDDFFPLSPLDSSDFFRPIHNSQFIIHNPSPQDNVNCKSSNRQIVWPCQRFTEKPFPEQPNMFQRFVKSGLDMVAADFGMRFRRTWLRGGHSMQPMLRSTVEKVCALHADRIAKSFTFMRNDRNFNQYIFPFYQHLSGQYIDHVPRRQYAGPRTATKDLAGIIRDKNAGIVCINDNECIDDWKERANIVRREIENKLKI